MQPKMFKQQQRMQLVEVLRKKPTRPRRKRKPSKICKAAVREQCVRGIRAVCASLQIPRVRAYDRSTRLRKRGGPFSMAQKYPNPMLIEGFYREILYIYRARCVTTTREHDYGYVCRCKQCSNWTGTHCFEEVGCIMYASFQFA